MAPAPLLVFDFDGVLFDGMAEYWWSARRAALSLAPGATLPETVPEGFLRLRPLIHKGWEMVLMAAELGRSDFHLDGVLVDYDTALAEALRRWGWQPAALQNALEQVRRAAIASDRPHWLGLHRPYPGIPERLAGLAAEGAAWMVLTTKGAAFATELLASSGLVPSALFGHEQGSKPEVLLQLREHRRPLWFIEDRRLTLEAVRTTPGLEVVRCYLATWGYLRPADHEDPPAGIRLLGRDRFLAPLAGWP